MTGLPNMVLPPEAEKELLKRYSKYRPELMTGVYSYRNRQQQRIVRDEFSAYIAVLHHRGGWTLAAISHVLGLSRERVRQQAESGLAQMTVDLDSIDVPIYEPPVRPKRVSIWACRDLTPEEVDKLVHLYDLARKTRGWHALDHPYRKASVEFSKMLWDLKQDGVHSYKIQQQTGIQKGTVRARLKRHGYEPCPPSQRGYMGKVLR